MLHNSPHPQLSSRNNQQKCCIAKSTTSALRFYKRFSRYVPLTVLVLFITILLIGATFVTFSEKIEHLTPPNPLPQADAIIVLTGGENRIKTGFDLLQKGLGSRLLISGVNSTIDLNKLIDATYINPHLLVSRVDFGYEATNTKGNAEESAAWIKQHNYKTVYIVTHDYHMVRSLLELKYLMPHIDFIAYPIKENTTGSWIKQINQMRILVSEYIKNIGVYIRTAF
ncbi:YdcF family protein [Bartonella schoenbuchensis]|uniref:Membrane protein n=1 Tax=Bartonella schoenbuchensis m07a TaxID=1094496 RepID=N6VHZ2_9HYPH|nr:YdcF family protein [Bartonella schoenbuchensis]ENN90682.1 putative membrane protein [Bartonella schoenbuchensis m07a]